MNQDQTYTLKELAEKTGLTERTTRYYIEQVLPPHHKKGRGKLARYGRDTLNAILFIKLVKDRHGFKPGQAKGVLANVDQATIDRVVNGEEDLAVMTVPTATASMGFRPPGKMKRASERIARYQSNEYQKFRTSRPEQKSDTFSLDAEIDWSAEEPEINEMASYSTAEPTDPWQTIFEDGQVRIQARSQKGLTPHQEEQIKAAARLIELTLK